MKKIHSESLLNFSLVRQALSDKNFKLQARAIDANWTYQKVVPISVAGFNPFLSTFYYAQNSVISEWLKKPEASARTLNEADVLVKEVFFLVHDYLHSWACRCIHALVPNFGFGTRPVTEKNFEDYVFFHLLTEAVATVGLDYWFLSTLNFNQICNLGSNFKSLTVAYREESLPEYRRFNPNLEVQHPRFFEQLTEFYCAGNFRGFSILDLQKSPMLLKWIEHELSYGEIQREYARSWFSFLSSAPFVMTQKKLTGSVDVSLTWRKRLVRDLGLLLWDKVKNGNDAIQFPKFDPSEIWKPAKNKTPDFRFLNVNTKTQGQLKDELRAREAKKSFEYLFHQWVSAHDYDSFDPKLIELFPSLIKKRDFEFMLREFRGQKRLERKSTEPEHLFILN